MTGWAFSIISPSSVTMTRSTPWVAGCCGPTLSVMSCVCSARSALSVTMMPMPVPSAAWKAAPAGAVSAALAPLPLPALVCSMMATATPLVPCPRARPWPPWPAGRTPCAAGSPRTPPAGAAWPGWGGRRSSRRTARRSRARASWRPPTGRTASAGARRRAAPPCGAGRGAGGWWNTRAAPRRCPRPPRPRRRGSRRSCRPPPGRAARTRRPVATGPPPASRSAGRRRSPGRAARNRTRRPGGRAGLRRPLGTHRDLIRVAHHDGLQLALGVALVQRLGPDALLELDDTVQQRRLPGAVRERDHAEADEVVPRHGGGDELDRAAGKAEVEHPQGVLAAPVEDEFDGLGKLDGVDQTHFRTPFRKA